MSKSTELEIIVCIKAFTKTSINTLISIYSSLHLSDLSWKLTVVSSQGNKQAISNFLNSIPIDYDFVIDLCQGYYHALNRAIVTLQGNKIMICNDGDLFLIPNLQYFEFLVRDNNHLTSFSVLNFNSSGILFNRLYKSNSKPRIFALFTMLFPHMGILAHKSVFTSNHFSTDVGYGADYLWVLNVLFMSAPRVDHL